MITTRTQTCVFILKKNSFNKSVGPIQTLAKKNTNHCHRHLANAHRTANRPKQQQVGRSLSQYIRTALEPDVGWFVGVLRAQLANNIAHPALNNRFS